MIFVGQQQFEPVREVFMAKQNFSRKCFGAAKFLWLPSTCGVPSHLEKQALQYGYVCFNSPAATGCITSPDMLPGSRS